MTDTNGDGQILRNDLKPVKAPLLGNTTYDVVNDVVVLAFPAAITLYVALAAFWNWPNTEAIVGSAGAVGVFLGVILKIAQKRWQKQPVEYDGVFIANDPNPEANTFRQELDKGLVELGNQSEVRLKVVNLLPDEYKVTDPNSR